MTGHNRSGAGQIQQRRCDCRGGHNRHDGVLGKLQLLQGDTENSRQRAMRSQHGPSVQEILHMHQAPYSKLPLMTTRGNGGQKARHLHL